jgi:hypothetical protein
MNKTSTKKRPNRKPAALAALAATRKRLLLGNTSTSTKPHKKTRKVSHQQTIQARDTLDAEYRDWRTGVSTGYYQIFRPFSSFFSFSHRNPYYSITSRF